MAHGLVMKPARLSLLGRTSSFDPDWPLHNLPSLQVWLDASRISTLFQDSAGTTPVTANNDPVGKMLDLSGNNRHVVQATTAAKPTYKTNILNGRSVLGFDGGDWMGNAAPGALLRNVAGATLIVVMQTSEPSTIRFSLVVTNGLATTSARASLGHGRAAPTDIDVGGRRLDADAFQSVQSAAGVISAGAWRVQTARISYATSEIWAYHNATLVAYSNAFQTAGATSDTDSVALAVGSVYGNASYAITGQIAEVCVCGADVTSPLLTRFWNEYSKPKWGKP